ncbi:MAG: hypothetical protein DLM56_10520 [Pseudonocardiales bacterium]|nr:MAG: hypothetical protein DLM56_10520 [Pseudonocardiales bacterium]
MAAQPLAGRALALDARSAVPAAIGIGVVMVLAVAVLLVRLRARRSVRLYGSTFSAARFASLMDNRAFYRRTEAPAEEGGAPWASPPAHPAPHQDQQRREAQHPPDVVDRP